MDQAQRLLEARPTLARETLYAGEDWPHLLTAAQRGDAAMVRLLLQYVPQAALCADWHHDAPLHWASEYGDSPAAVELLLAAAPQVCAWRDNDGDTPLRCAALRGAAETVRLLVAADPAVARTRNRRHQLPLDLVLWGEKHQPPPQARCAAARHLLEATLPLGPRTVLKALVKAAPEVALPLYPDLVAHCRLGKHWQRVPAPCPGLGALLPALVARGDEAEAAQAAQRLPEVARQRLRAGALCLARWQRLLGISLPSALSGRVLALAAADD